MYPCGETMLKVEKQTFNLLKSYLTFWIVFLGVAVIDSSVFLYGTIFPRTPQKHRLQMLQHFAKCIVQNKAQRQQVRAEANEACC